ncbi:PadR family transcriptional regulator [Terrihabitans sp. B22-R8]|uniref:PadR family transcriptional regulator n=1 Tax=Terrihabitans sp. B22-R8 TaxID=3425128 RepID=UPI00403D14E7
MNVQTVCLALLAHGEASGYDLKRRWTEGPFDHFVEASFGSIYPALARLEQQGFVTVRTESQTGKPARKVYSLTETGRKAFVEALSAPPEPDVYRSSFALIALCAPFLPREVIAGAIDTRIAQQRGQLAELEAVRPECSYPPIKWLLEWGIRHFSADLAHVEAYRSELETLSDTGTPGLSIDVSPAPSKGH